MGLATIIAVIAMGVVTSVMARGADLGPVEDRYFEIDSKLGHSASGPEHAKWSPVLREFLEPFMAGLD